MICFGSNSDNQYVNVMSIHSHVNTNEELLHILSRLNYININGTYSPKTSFVLENMSCERLTIHCKCYNTHQMRKVFKLINVNVSVLGLVNAVYIPSTLLHIRDLTLIGFCGKLEELFLNLNDGLQKLHIGYTWMERRKTFECETKFPETLIDVRFDNICFPSNKMSMFSKNLKVFICHDPDFVNGDNLDRLAIFTKLESIQLYDKTHIKNLILCKSLKSYNLDTNLEHFRLKLIFSSLISVPRLRIGTRLPIELVRMIFLTLY